MIALLSSMPFESDLIFSSLKKKRTQPVGGRKMTRGYLSDREVILCITGIGKVNAAQAVTAVMENAEIERVLNFGIGGAYPGSGLKRGDVAVASSEYFADDGVVMPPGFRGMDEIGIPVLSLGRRKYFNEFPLDVRLPGFAGAAEAAGSSMGFAVQTGRFLTVSAVSGSQKRAQELEKRHRALCENMEGAAVAQVCTLYGIPVHGFRGISNVVGVRDRRRWKMKEAARNCQSCVLQVLGEMNQE